MKNITRILLIFILSTTVFMMPPEAIIANAVAKPAKSKLTLSTITYNSVKLNFKKVKDVTGYRVYRSTKKLTGYKLIKKTSSLSYTDTNLLPNTTYYYKIRTYKTKGKKTYTSNSSNRVDAKTKFDTPKITQKGYNDNIVVDITKKSAGATNYRIYRSTNGKTFDYIGETNTTTYYDAKSLKANQTYYYKSRGYRVVNNKKYYTPYSNVTLGKLTGRALGIDVSKYQKEINWEQVKASGISFAIIRAGFRGNGEAGTLNDDPYFHTNMKNAIKAGIKVGAYYYSTAKTKEEAIAEAKELLRLVKSYNITYPLAFDFEEWGKNRTKNVTGKQATDNAIAFCDTIAKAGYEPIIYASKSHYTQKYETSRLAKYKYWLAHWTTNGVDSDYKGSYHLWQYTSDGCVPGIVGRVDMNAYIGYVHEHDFSELVIYEGLDGYMIYKCKCGLTEKRFIDTIPDGGE